MKTKIISLICVSIFLAITSTHAQDYKVAVENSKNGILSLYGFSGDISIEGYTGTEIIISSANLEENSSANLEEKIPERAKGLKPVYPAGIDNTGKGLSVEKSGNQITITSLLPFTQSGEYTLKVPENLSLKMQSGCENNSDVTVKKMKSEIEIQTCGSINLKEVSGPLVLSTIAGDINIAFAGLNTEKPFSINSVSGEIDITLPSKTAADIEMESITGAMYSDFDFTTNDKDMKRIGGNHLTSSINGGGTSFNIVTVSGNVYLRKGI